VVHCSELLAVELACIHLAVHHPVVASLHAAHLQGSRGHSVFGVVWRLA
jgi:hypothetical protein